MVDGGGLGSEYVGGGADLLEEENSFAMWVGSCWVENEFVVVRYWGWWEFVEREIPGT